MLYGIKWCRENGVLKLNVELKGVVDCMCAGL